MLARKINYVAHLIRNYSNWFSIIYCRLFKKPITKVVLKNRTTIIGSKKSLTLDIVDEVFIREVYNLNLLKIKKGDVVVDIGANTGIFSMYAAIKGASNIYSIEPLRENIKLIKKNFAINNLTLPICINIAISNKNGQSKLYLSDYDSHNLLFNKNNLQEFHKYRMVRSLKFERLLEEFGIKKIDFLKIDCEGSEGFIFDSLNKKVWKNINKVSIEYHNGVSVLSDGEIIKKLINLGFKVKRIKSDNLFGYIYARK